MGAKAKKPPKAKATKAAKKKTAKNGPMPHLYKGTAYIKPNTE